MASAAQIFLTNTLSTISNVATVRQAIPILNYIMIYTRRRMKSRVEIEILYLVIVIASTYALCANGFMSNRNMLSSRAKANKNLYCEESKHVLHQSVHAVPNTNEYQILENRIKRMESILRDVCGAVMYCDDITVMERRTAEHGVIYRGTGIPCLCAVLSIIYC